MTAAILARGRPAKERGSDIEAAQCRFGLILALPAIVVFCVLILGPFLNSLWLAFHEYRLTSEFPTFVGLRNLAALTGDLYFWQAWRNTLVFVTITTTLTTCLGTVYALLLNEALPGRALIRSASLLPWVLPSTVTAFLWSWLFHGQYGVINAGLLSAGLIDGPVFWLSSSAGAMAGVILAKSWLSTPVVFLFVLAALQSVPHDQIEAARIDCAGDFAVIRHVVMPHIRRTIGIVVVLQAMANLQTFDVIYAMTAGGPVRATTVLSIEVYRRAFESWDLGMASAIGIIWFLTIAMFAITYLRMLLQEAA
jgi:multiple sugar transport system permease protein